MFDNLIAALSAERDHRERRSDRLRVLIDADRRDHEAAADAEYNDGVRFGLDLALMAIDKIKTDDPNALEGDRCECNDRGWWVIASDGDDSRDWVERCDDCRRFDTDDDAAEAAAEATGRTVGHRPLHEGTEDQSLAPRPYLKT